VLSAVALGGPVIPESKGSQNRNVDNDVRRMREREMDNRTVTRWEFRAEPKKRVLNGTWPEPIRTCSS